MWLQIEEIQKGNMLCVIYEGQIILMLINVMKELHGT
jgi:hypothetical protein